MTSKNLKGVRLRKGEKLGLTGGGGKAGGGKFWLVNNPDFSPWNQDVWGGNVKAASE